MPAQPPATQQHPRHFAPLVLPRSHRPPTRKTRLSGRRDPTTTLTLAINTILDRYDPAQTIVTRSPEALIAKDAWMYSALSGACVPSHCMYYQHTVPPPNCEPTAYELLDHSSRSRLPTACPSPSIGHVPRRSSRVGTTAYPTSPAVPEPHTPPPSPSGTCIPTTLAADPDYCTHLPHYSQAQNTQVAIRGVLDRLLSPLPEVDATGCSGPAFFVNVPPRR